MRWVSAQRTLGAEVFGLRLLFGDRDLTLSPGEAAEFDTSLPHWLGSADGGAVELLIVFGPQGTRAHLRTPPGEPPSPHG